MHNFINSSTIFLFVLLSLFTFFSNSHAKGKTHGNLVLGLNHVRSLSTSPMALAGSKTLEFLDVIEPLATYRDGYLLSLNLGTPPQVLQVYMDTGSDLTWVPCGNTSFECMDCGEHSSSKPSATFSPSQSSSCTRDLCASLFCVDVHSSDNPYDPCAMAGCSVPAFMSGLCPRPCPPFSYTYGGGGLVLGSLARDTARVHGSLNGISVPIEFPSFCFGCVGNSFREPIGIAGFGMGALSLPAQLGFLDRGFSHCFLGLKFAKDPNITSPLVIGDLALSSKEEFLFTPMLKNFMYPNYYYIGLEGVSTGNGSIISAPLSLNSFDSEGNGGVIVDTGTTYTHLPGPFYSSVLSCLSSEIPYERSYGLEMRTGFDLCYKIPCTRSSCSDHELPLISFHFLGNVKLTLSKDSCFYAVTAPRDSLVVKCLLFQRMDEEDDDQNGPGGVFGSFQMQNVEVVYDLETERIGFQPRDCATSTSSYGLHH